MLARARPLWARVGHTSTRETVGCAFGKSEWSVGCRESGRLTCATHSGEVLSILRSRLGFGGLSLHMLISLPRLASALVLAAVANAQTGRSLIVQAPPAVGTTCTFSVVHPATAAGNPYVVLWSLAYPGTTAVTVPGLTVVGELRLDPAGLLTLFSGAFDGTGSIGHSLPIPANPDLLGVGFDLQSADLDVARATLALAENDLALVVSGLRYDWGAAYDHGIIGHDTLSSVAATAAGCVCTGSSLGYFPQFPTRPYQYEVVTVRYSATGTRLWERRYHSNGVGFADTGVAAHLAADGSVTVLGQGPGATSDQDVFVIRYDAQGTEQWATRWNQHWSDGAVALAVTADGSVYALASSYYLGAVTDIVLLKFNAAGALVWQRNFDGGNGATDVGVDLRLDSRGNIAIGGYSVGTGVGTNFDWIALEYDANGNLLWSRRIIGSPTLPDYCWGMTVDPLDNVVLTGTLAANPGGYCAAKLDPAGNLLWTRALGAPGGAPYCEARGDVAGNLYFASNGSVVAVDAAGGPRWQHAFSGQARAIEIDSGGRVMVAVAVPGGGVGQQFGLYAFDANGRPLGSHSWGGVRDDYVASRAMVVVGNAVYVAGSGHNGHDNDGYVARLTLWP